MQTSNQNGQPHSKASRLINSNIRHQVSPYTAAHLRSQGHHVPLSRTWYCCSSNRHLKANLLSLSTQGQSEIRLARSRAILCCYQSSDHHSHWRNPRILGGVPICPRNSGLRKEAQAHQSGFSEWESRRGQSWVEGDGSNCVPAWSRPSFRQVIYW